LWWTHALLLGLFAWVLVMNRVAWIDFAKWFVIALMPEAVLGIWQFLVQKIDGSTIFGVAPLRAWMNGASVVEYGEYRILRAYAGFPHPNVLGGWLALGLALIPELIRQARATWEKYAWIMCDAVCMMALVFSFSRGAWLAAFVGGVIASYFAWKQATKAAREGLLLAWLLVVIVATLTATLQWDAVRTRFTGSERLERWSMEQRVTSLQDGVQAWQRHPVIGWGAGASLVGVSALNHPLAPLMARLTADGEWETWRAPLEPPHVVPLMMLVELGALGFLAVLVLFGIFIRFLIRTKRMVPALSVLAIGVVLAMTDHYLWSLWAGMSLLAVMTASMTLLDPEKKNGPSQHA
jgi:hypothetical protein